MFAPKIPAQSPKRMVLLYVSQASETIVLHVGRYSTGQRWQFAVNAKFGFRHFLFAVDRLFESSMECLNLRSCLRKEL